MEEANRPLPVPKDGVTFESLIRNREEVEHFKEFLNKKHARGNSGLNCFLFFFFFFFFAYVLKLDSLPTKVRFKTLVGRFTLGPKCTRVQVYLNST